MVFPAEWLRRGVFPHLGAPAGPDGDQPRRPALEFLDVIDAT
jgi:hypothetical protein